jgi:hypothetical protein
MKRSIAVALRSFAGIAPVIILSLLNTATAGASWTVRESPNPTGATRSSLLSVSCVSASACTAVGYFVNTKELPLAEQWNGKAWTVQEPELPLGDSGHLNSVSCPASSACIAVGTEYNPQSYAVSEWWNGKTWASYSIPGSHTDLLEAVSCASATSCMAVGKSLSGTEDLLMADHWNGKVWTATAVPALPNGAKSGTLQSISCVSETACTAVGELETSSGKGLLGEQWNGTSWKAQELPRPAGSNPPVLEGVSCSAATTCTAAGAYTPAGTSKQQPITETWNGTGWSLHEVFKAKGGASSKLIGIACLSTDCTAVGRYETKGENYGPFAEELTGTSWAALELPTPTGAKSSTLSGVSCLTTGICTGAGWYENSQGVTVTLVEES